MNDCLNIVNLAIENMTVNADILNDPKYDYLFSVEEVNKLVLNGVPFREAYKQIGMQIEEGQFHPEKLVKHTHEGSIGNLCLNEIGEKLNKTLQSFNFERVEEAKNKLLDRQL
ncbi:MAG: hypothetical protein ACK5M7_19850 [Draconibacterium sp.]